MDNAKKSKGRALAIASQVIIGTAILLLMALVIYFVICQVQDRLAFVGGRAVVRIATGSMEPAIMTGDYISVERVAPEEIREGDVITFYSSDPAIAGMLNTHRVIEITDGPDGLVFTTKGDNNPVKDAYTVSADAVAARFVSTLPALTSAANLLLNKYVFLFAILLPAAVLTVLSMLDLGKAARERRMERLVQAEVERLKAQHSADGTVLPESQPEQDGGSTDV